MTFVFSDTEWHKNCIELNCNLNSKLWLLHSKETVELNIFIKYPKPYGFYYISFVIIKEIGITPASNKFQGFF